MHRQKRYTRRQRKKIAIFRRGLMQPHPQTTQPHIFAFSHSPRALAFFNFNLKSEKKKKKIFFWEKLHRPRVFVHFLRNESITPIPSTLIPATVCTSPPLIAPIALEMHFYAIFCNFLWIFCVFPFDLFFNFFLFLFLRVCRGWGTRCGRFTACSTG